MLSVIKNYFRRPIVKFGTDISNFVSVLDSDSQDKKKDDICCGMISKIDFNKRILEIEAKSAFHKKSYTTTIPFNKIVTISRMKDGRLRMWIKTEED